MRIWNYIKGKSRFLCKGSLQNRQWSWYKKCTLSGNQSRHKTADRSKCKEIPEPLNCLEKRVKLFLKNDYVEFWKDKIRNSPTYASYATHKNDYTMEAYLIHMRIKKHRNALAKFRLSDHQFHIQTSRQPRPKTPQNLRNCKNSQTMSRMKLIFTFYFGVKKLVILKMT